MLRGGLRLLIGPSQIPPACRSYATLNPFRWAKEKFQESIESPTSLSEKDTKEAQRLSRQEGTSSIFTAQAPPRTTKTPTATRSTKPQGIVKRKKQFSHGYSTSFMRISHRKLNLLSRQIAGKPIDHAILQMQFSEKRVSTRLKNMLATAKHHAVKYKGMEASKLIVAESWVNKGKLTSKKMFPAGRGHHGIIQRRLAQMKVVLKEGRTMEEKRAAEFNYKLKRVASAGVVREDRPLRNPGSMWAW